MNSISVSAGNVISLSAMYPYDTKLDLLYNIHAFDDGYTFLHNPILDGAKDVKFGKDTLFYISSASEFINYMLDVSRTINILDLAFFTTFQLDNGTYLLNTNNTLYVSADASPLDDIKFFNIVRNIDGTISLFQNGLYVTVSRTAPYNLTLESQYSPDEYNQQKFNFYLVGKHLLISTVFTNPTIYGPTIIQRFVSDSPLTHNARAVGLISDDDYSGSNDYMFNVTFYASAFNTGFNSSINWVKYFNDFNNKQHNKDVNIDRSINDISQNYLISLPYKTKITGNTSEVNINNLKNIETPEYEFATAPYISGGLSLSSVDTPEAIKRREYEQIFMGTNQDEGYDNPFLEFSAYTKAMTFVKDALTYFHYPITAPRIALSAAGLVEAGSIPGTSPVRADKIWKKMANYSKNIQWGNSQQWQRGTFLCSWLSGSEDYNPHVKGVWKDRWYYPGYITPVQAGSAVEMVYFGHTPVVWDEDSSMTFDPGVWYKYYHKGEDGNLTIVKSLTGNGTALGLWLDEWAATTIDKSPNDNDGIIQPEFTDDMVVGDNLKLNGIDQECFVPYNSTYNTNGEITVSFWAKANDWNNVKGNHFVDNNFRGGWSIGYSNGFFTPIVPTFDTTYGHVILSNNDNSILTDTLIPISGAVYADPVAILIDKNLFTWVLDNGVNKSLYKLDYNGNILKQIHFSNITLQDMVLDRDQNIWILNSNQLSAINTFGYLVSTATGTGNSIDVNKSNTIIVSDYSDICVDNSNNVWGISAQNVYKNNLLMLSGTNISRLACDKDNNIWLLNTTTDFIKLNNIGAFILSGSVTNNPVVSSRAIGFTNEYSAGQYKDYVWIVQGSDQILYKYDIVGNYVSDNVITNGIDLTQYLSHKKSTIQFNANGDFTGYDWDRKFRYLVYGGSVVEAKLTLGSLISSQTLVLTQPTSTLSTNDIHQFVITYDTDGTYKFYVDNVLRDSESVAVGSLIYHEYENGLVIGGNMGRSVDLDTELKTNKYHFEGQISDVRIYDWPLNNSDIGHLYFLKSEFKDLVWNMPTGVQNYLEEVERFFKHKLPGLKSQFYNIKLNGLQITDTSTRSLIETIIRNTVTKVAPAYTELYRIIWD